ncbi:hypothetical protein ACFPYI_14765 [Halomarina salina]|uniref:Uncharacterized protein n=1 Tax=Halomarina salina TaxID=1872699 RepID=A0ABD5RQF4_9EURY|nr:hypothetical protein [Halomarina salina]
MTVDGYDTYIPEFTPNEEAPDASFIRGNLSKRFDRIDRMAAEYSELSDAFFDGEQTVTEVETSKVLELQNGLDDELRLFFVIANATFNFNCASIAYQYLVRPELRTGALLELFLEEVPQDALEQMLVRTGLLGTTLVGHMSNIQGKRAMFSHDVVVTSDWEGTLRPWASRTLRINEALYDFNPRESIEGEME